MVIVFLANGCEEIEALSVIDTLRRGNVEVKGVSISDSLVVKGAHGIEFMADCTFQDINFDKAEMVVLPGGLGGRDNLMADKNVVTVCKKFNELGKYVTAICASPSVLGENGILQGRKATCYPGFEKQCKGAEMLEDRVVKDGNIITSKGPGTAFEFAIELLRELKGDREADSVAEGLLLN